MANQPVAPIDQPPPDLPNMPDVSDTLSRYLRTFSLWCRNGFHDKLSSTAALPEVLLQGYNAPAGTLPTSWSLQTAQNGGLFVTPIAAGSGVRGTPVLAGSSSFLPLGGGTITGNLQVNGTFNAGLYATPLNIAANGVWTYAGFYDSGVTRRGYVGYNSSGNVMLVNDAGSNLTIGAGSASFNSALDCANFTTRNGGTTQTYSNGWIAQPGGSATFNIYSAGAQGDAFMSLVSQGYYGVNFGLNPNGYTYRGGWSDGNNYYANWTAREVPSPACDYRFKRDVEPLKSTWSMVKALKPIRFHHKEFINARGGHPLVHADKRERFGFIAHELQETLGETAAHIEKDHPDILQAPNILMLVAALTRTVQELQERVIELETPKGVRVYTKNDTLNSAVPNGGFLRFDAVGADTHGFAPKTTPFDKITIPPGHGGVYILTGRSSGSGDQSTSLGMGILVNGSVGFRETNQTIWGPGSVDYTLDNDATQLLQLKEGDVVQLKNNSISSGPNIFTSVSMAIARLA